VEWRRILTDSDHNNLVRKHRRSLQLEAVCPEVKGVLRNTRLVSGEQMQLFIFDEK